MRFFDRGMGCVGGCVSGVWVGGVCVLDSPCGTHLPFEHQRADDSVMALGLGVAGSLASTGTRAETSCGMLGPDTSAAGAVTACSCNPYGEPLLQAVS